MVEVRGGGVPFSNGAIQNELNYVSPRPESAYLRLRDFVRTAGPLTETQCLSLALGKARTMIRIGSAHAYRPACRQPRRRSHEASWGAKNGAKRHAALRTAERSRSASSGDDTLFGESGMRPS